MKSIGTGDAGEARGGAMDRRDARDRHGVMKSAAAAEGRSRDIRDPAGLMAC
ncbi:hypothetical protein [uncultured Sphingomonas sp.]|uniref:hypothetical protein n=1 Tax=uncultured Sphingomonas sp. TaxID=158754 RepID=UPI0026387D06|nr:hypothetical protein [uncultured Sphingomonas sp.]